MKRLIFAVSVASILSFGIQLSSHYAYAAGKVDCDKVMEEINSGKTVAEVAKDMGVARRSVRRCRRHHGSEGEEKMGGAAATGSSSMASPAPAAPAPAAPAPEGH